MYQSKTTHRTVCTYNHDYTKEFMDVEAREIPCHRLLLLPEHFEDTHRIFHVTSSWLGEKMSNWKLVQAILVTLTQAQFDEVFCTTESSAWYILMFKQLGLLKLPVTVVNVAMLRPAYRTAFVRFVIGRLLKHANLIISYASFQIQLINSTFGVPQTRQRFVKFQVDRQFIQTHKNCSRGAFILSVGTNEGRDFETLLQAVGPTLSLVVCTDYYNKKLIVRSKNYSPDRHIIMTDVPYLSLLNLYCQCRVFISCLHDVDYSSGQTVIQEALLLCEKVIVSDVKTIRNYVEPSEHVWLVSPDSPYTYQELIKRLF
jgi:hypothetical protein